MQHRPGASSKRLTKVQWMTIHAVSSWATKFGKQESLNLNFDSLQALLASGHAHLRHMRTNLERPSASKPVGPFIVSKACTKSSPLCQRPIGRGSGSESLIHDCLSIAQPPYLNCPCPWDSTGSKTVHGASAENTNTLCKERYVPLSLLDAARSSIITAVYLLAAIWQYLDG